MKRERHDPTTCLLSAKYAWKVSQRGPFPRDRSEDVSRWLAEAISWTWLFRMVGAPLDVIPEDFA